MNTKKPKEKVVSMLSCSRYLMAKAQNRLAKAQARWAKREAKLEKIVKKKVDELFVEGPAGDLSLLYDELAEVSAKQEEHDHSKCNHDHT